MASTTDNASVNGVANETICKLITKDSKTTRVPSPSLGGSSTETPLAYPNTNYQSAQPHSSRQLIAKDIQVGCAAHVTNLVVQAFLSGIGLAPDPEDEDWYEEARGLPLVYDGDQNEETVEEVQKMRDEIVVEQQGGVVLVDISEDADSDADIDSADEESGDEAVGGATKHKKTLTAVDKVHSIALSNIHDLTMVQLHCICVEICCSEKKRGEFRKLTWEFCDSMVQDLILICSMPIRWNTTYFEIEHGIALKEMSFILILDNSL